jgi:hypothetical protein
VSHVVVAILHTLLEVVVELYIVDLRDIGNR